MPEGEKPQRSNEQRIARSANLQPSISACYIITYSVRLTGLTHKNMTLKQLAEKYGYEVRHHTQTLTTEESIAKVIRPFEFSSRHGGTVDGFKFYNDFYLYPVA